MMVTQSTGMCLGSVLALFKLFMIKSEISKHASRAITFRVAKRYGEGELAQVLSFAEWRCAW